LRIACAPDETVAGCEDGNTRWDWLPPGPASEELDAIALEQIAGDDPLPADTAQALSLDTAKRAPLLSEPRQTLLPAEANE
jgi:hypothetical protein